MLVISVVIVTRNREREVIDLLADLEAMPREPADEIAVVDNGSTDRTVGRIRSEFPGVRLIAFPENRGAPAARNAAASVASGELLVFLDDDVRVSDAEFLGRIRAAFDGAPEMDVAAFRILDPRTGRSRRFEIPRRRKDLEGEPCETSVFVSAGCAVRRAAYRAAGGMDESLVYGFEELDFSYRAVARGSRLFYRPDIRVTHFLSDAGRPSGRRIYYFFRNKIWISVRYLPWRMVFTQLAVWSGYFLVEALKAGRPGAYLKALGAGLSGLPERIALRSTDRLAPETLRRLRSIEGRLYY